MAVYHSVFPLVVACCLTVLAACTGRPAGYAVFEPLPQALDSQGQFDGVYVGEGESRSCVIPGGNVRIYDPPVIAGVVHRGQFVGNLDGCRVAMDVYAAGSVRGWTFIRTHRLVPVTYSLFEGRIADGALAGRFEQVLQGGARCDRGPVVLTGRDIESERDPQHATLDDAIEFYSPATRCRTGGSQFP